MGSFMDAFRMEATRFYWLKDDGRDDPDDLCLHGHVITHPLARSAGAARLSAACFPKTRLKGTGFSCITNNFLKHAPFGQKDPRELLFFRVGLWYNSDQDERGWDRSWMHSAWKPPDFTG